MNTNQSQALQLFLSMMRDSPTAAHHNSWKDVLNRIDNHFVDDLLMGLPQPSIWFSRLYFHLLDREFPSDRIRWDEARGNEVKWDIALIHALTKALARESPEYWAGYLQSEEEALIFICKAINDI